MFSRLASKDDSEKSKNSRTVLLIGRTGNGKSTCANVIAGYDPSKAEEQLFKESDTAASETKDIHDRTVTVTWKKQKYDLKIVDTIGLGDTDMPEDKVIKCLANVCNVCKEGINVIFFVVGGRMTEVEADTWDTIWKIIFTAQICDFTTLIRTKFQGFMRPDRVKADIDALKKCETGRRVMSMVKKVIHIDNPTLMYQDSEDPMYQGIKAIRAKSREALLTKIVLSEKVYKPPELDEVNDRITRHVEEKSAADDKIAKLEKEKENARDELEKFRIQAAVSEERAKSAQAEARLLREMNEVLRERAQRAPEPAAADSGSDSSCSIM
ncbi:uncharacterized protein LOC134183231 [Corticium candelabrum]|uniref:uncharacterized protein LOC134183231 n=1 Tax=Corticium candelabrum TaxID=121492 RepID=UPI002E262714|nr:uncharacterized protein LOC134183231 [Corticium candelabrum]